MRGSLARDEKPLIGLILGGSCEMTHLFWENEWRRLSSLRFWSGFMAFRRLESLRHSFRKTPDLGDSRETSMDAALFPQ
jgi:hypothetical protein